MMKWLVDLEPWQGGLLFAGLAVLGMVLSAQVKDLRERLFPTTVGGRLRKFLGRSLADAQTHDKSYPGYDLASVNRALTGYLAERCARYEALGSIDWASHVRGVLEVVRSPEVNRHALKSKPSAASYTRLPVDLGVEESFVSNCLYLCVLRPDVAEPAGAPPASEPDLERVVILLRTASSRGEYGEDMESATTPTTSVHLSIACRSKRIADLFFEEIEQRRKRLSVFRGKMIDPVVHGGGIQTIGFRRIKPVAGEDLILPAEVRSLLHRSIVGFYRHRDVLRSLGVEMKRGILLHGPPGTGKTSVSLHLAGRLPSFTVCFVSGQKLLHPRELCRMARYLQPAMLVFEDIDLIAQERDVNGLATVLGELMNQIDGCEPDDQVLFVMTTNSLDRLEQAVRNRPGRVDQIVQLPLPDAAARAELIRHFARNLRLAEGCAGRVAEQTDGATPAMLKEVVKRAAVSAVERAAEADAGGNGQAPPAASSPGAAVEITEADLMLAAHQIQYLRDRSGLVGSSRSEAVL